MFKRNRGSPPKFCLNECDGCYFADISTQEHRIRRIRCVQAFTDVASFYSRSATTYKNPIRFFMNIGKMYAKTLIITYAFGFLGKHSRVSAVDRQNTILQPP